jgi:alkanesulfonate monooxygenase SsuD/methylene tetrahydromethanopterin reductase-like flavin-dependent oxidoreductase (luciferase family)
MAAPPPIFVGGRGDVALRRAARFGDGWLPMWLSPEQVAERGERLGELAVEYGRPRPKLALLFGVHVDEERGRARRTAAAYIHGQYGMDLARVEHWTGLGEVERITEQLEAYRAVGVEEFVLMPLTGDPLTQIARLAEVRERLLATAAVETSSSLLLPPQPLGRCVSS